MWVPAGGLRVGVSGPVKGFGLGSPGLGSSRFESSRGSGMRTLGALPTPACACSSRPPTGPWLPCRVPSGRWPHCLAHGRGRVPIPRLAQSSLREPVPPRPAARPLPESRLHSWWRRAGPGCEDRMGPGLALGARTGTPRLLSRAFFLRWFRLWNPPSGEATRYFDAGAMEPVWHRMSPLEAWWPPLRVVAWRSPRARVRAGLSSAAPPAPQPSRSGPCRAGSKSGETTDLSGLVFNQQFISLF